LTSPTGTGVEIASIATCFARSRPGVNGQSPAPPNYDRSMP
jgi:hypothetical protein